ncbi:MAG: hypothetical protein WCI91_01515 [Candidatus Nomurabacteria bacterium]
MKNKTFKNLIVVAFFALIAITANTASAYTTGIPFGYNVGYDNNIYSNYAPFYPAQQQTVQANSYQYQTTTNSNYVQQQQQPYTYVQPQAQYVAQPTTVQQVQYVPQQQKVQYVNTNNSQGASAANALSSNTTTKKVVTSNSNTGYTSNTGKYINYDNNNAMGATAYQYNSAGQILTTPVIDSNGVAALSVKGSGSFMPSSVFQWIMLILVILAIIVVARMIARRSQTNDPHAVPVH